jgi:hypothetical protein
MFRTYIRRNKLTYILPWPTMPIFRHPLLPGMLHSFHLPLCLYLLQRDIKSPIILAQQKQALKLGLPQNSTDDVLPKIKPAFDKSSSPTKGTLQPSKRGDEGVTPNGSGFPELPSPGVRDEGGLGSGKAVGGSGVVMDKEGNVQHVTYAVAIYPYVRFRNDQ